MQGKQHSQSYYSILALGCDHCLGYVVVRETILYQLSMFSSKLFFVAAKQNAFVSLKCITCYYYEMGI
jgi:hypothetical protein